MPNPETITVQMSGEDAFRVRKSLYLLARIFAETGRDLLDVDSMRLAQLFPDFRDTPDTQMEGIGDG